MDFYVLQVSLLAQDEDLFYQQGKEKDIHLVENCLLNEWGPESGRPLVLRAPQVAADGILFGKASKPVPVHIYDEKFARHDAQSYPPLIWVWDRVEQTLLVEIRTRILSDADAAARAFMGVINPSLAKDQVTAHIYPKLNEESFWQAYDALESVVSVEFELATPNIFGNTKAALSDFLKGVRGSTNATTFKPTFVNEDGNIRLKKDKNLNALLDWTKDGGGAWKIIGKSASGKRVKSRSSGKTARVFSTPDGAVGAELEGYSIKEIISIVEALRKQYTFKR